MGDLVELSAAQHRMQRKRKAVAWWLLAGVAMTVFQILLGGITRLTGSGLSIAEWKPILGAVPPMNEAEWSAAFELYKLKAAGQFVYQNSDFTLSDFKAIYFWEWLHREWARLLGVVFLVGFVIFLVRRYFDQKMILPFVVLFLLGILQGAVGWIMVASGLNPEDTHVSHIKLALHFIFALVLLCYVLWFALQLRIPDSKKVPDRSLYRLTGLVLVLLTIQLIYGAFMAGLKAAPAAPTWPSVNGSFLPENPGLYGGQVYKGLHLLTDQPIMVHYIHRSIAYLLLVLIAAWCVQLRRRALRSGSVLLSRAASATLLFTVLQVLLGILTVLNAQLMTQNRFGRFELLAELHQMVAIFLLMSLILNLYLLKPSRQSA